MSSYKAEFFDKLHSHIWELNRKLTTDKEGNLTRSIENTCYWAKALHDTFSDMRDVGGMMGMIVSCDYTPLAKAELEAQKKHDAELKTAVETVANRLSGKV